MGTQKRLSMKTSRDFVFAKQQARVLCGGVSPDGHEQQDDSRQCRLGHNEKLSVALCGGSFAALVATLILESQSTRCCDRHSRS